MTARLPSASARVYLATLTSVLARPYASEPHSGRHERALPRVAIMYKICRLSGRLPLQSWRAQRLPARRRALAPAQNIRRYGRLRSRSSWPSELYRKNDLGIPVGRSRGRRADCSCADELRLSYVRQPFLLPAPAATLAQPVTARWMPSDVVSFWLTSSGLSGRNPVLDVPPSHRC